MIQQPNGLGIGGEKLPQMQPQMQLPQMQPMSMGDKLKNAWGNLTGSKPAGVLAQTPPSLLGIRG